MYECEQSDSLTTVLGDTEECLLETGSKNESADEGECGLASDNAKSSIAVLVQTSTSKISNFHIFCVASLNFLPTTSRLSVSSFATSVLNQCDYENKYQEQQEVCVMHVYLVTPDWPV